MGLSSVFVLTNSLRLKRISLGTLPHAAQRLPSVGLGGAQMEVALQPVLSRRDQS